MHFSKREYVSRREASKILGIGFRSVDPFCSRNRVRIWQLPGSRFRLYRLEDLNRILSEATRGYLTEDGGTQPEASVKPEPEASVKPSRKPRAKAGA